MLPKHVKGNIESFLRKSQTPSEKNLDSQSVFFLSSHLYQEDNTKKGNSQCRTGREGESIGSGCSARKRKTVRPRGISCIIRKQRRMISSRGVRALTGTSYCRAKASSSAFRGKYFVLDKYAWSSVRSIRRGSRGGGSSTQSIFVRRFGNCPLAKT
jgi:hypothetical protein